MRATILCPGQAFLRHLLGPQHRCVGVLLAVLLLVPCRVPAQGPATPADAVYDFALHLFRSADYYRAITEFQRFTVLFPQHGRAPAAQLLIGLALQEEHMYEAAVAHFQRWSVTTADGDAARVAALKPGELRFLQGQYQQAAVLLQAFLEAYPQGPLVTHARYLLGLSWLLDGQLVQAQHVFALLPDEAPLAAQARALQDELRVLPLVQPQSPQVAGILAGILPGSGHLYAGKPLQALTAFALNGVFLAGAAYAFREKLEIPGAILLFFETGWYLGNIHSAMDATREANQQQQKRRIERLRSHYAPPTLTLQVLQAPEVGLRMLW